MTTQYTNVEHIQLNLQNIAMQSFEIQDCDQTKLVIEAGEHINTNVFISYTGKSSCIDCEVKIAANATVNLLFWNKLEQQADFVYRFELQQDAQAHIGFGDLQAGKSTYKVSSTLQNRGSDLHIRSACVGNQKRFTMDITHVAPYTKALMENFAIVKQHGEYEMRATGAIKKGAYGASSHQASRVLTLAQEQISEVVPVLLIDENDVKASHATTLGQPDENQLYYLCSRGLSRQEAIGLLTVGYLMPISEVLKDADIKKEIIKEIEEKVI